MSRRSATLSIALLLCAASLSCGYRRGEYVGPPVRPPQEEHPGPGEHRYWMQFQGWERSYLLNIPASYVPGEALPLVIMFHGAGGKAKHIERQTGWAAKGEKEKFVTVFPDGTPPVRDRPVKFLMNPQSWNDGGGRGAASMTNENDVVFTQALIADVGRRVSVDLNRVYAAGFSNGASMVFRLAAELSNKLAAAGAVAGHYRLKGYTPARPVPFVYIVGTDDPLTPMDGGEVTLPWDVNMIQPPVMETVRAWTQLQGCAKEPDETQMNGPVTLHRYGPCRSGGEVEFYLIDGMGHVWPGGDPMLPEWVVGPSSDAIRATDVLWEFFRRHSLGSAVSPSWVPGAEAQKSLP